MNQSLIRSLQIISFALTSGLLMIGIVFIGLHFIIFEQQPMLPEQRTVPLWLLSIVVAIMASIVAVMMSGQLLKNATEKIRNGTYVPPPNAPPMVLLSEVLIFNYRSAHILRLAMIEGSGILGLLLFLISGNLLALIGPAIALAVLLAFFSTETKVMSWVNEQTEFIEQSRNSQYREPPPQNSL
ncbi:MAG: hypothetical protein N2112_13365 [Gemmataceae bacterium]|jgi:hypothetical protein|nr:hypothetical protein [Gemmataceae bacterium]